MTTTLRYLSARLGGALLLAGCLLAARPAAAQWVTQASNLPRYWSLASISIVDASNVWATSFDTSPSNTDGTNYNNTYIRTTNGGTTWTVATIPDAVSQTLVNVSAVSPAIAWISSNDYKNGGGRLYYTADGGATWTRQLSAGFPAATSGGIDGVLAFSATQAVAIGDPAASGNFEIYTTTDGGTTWKAATTPARLDANEFSVSGNVVTVPGANPAARSCWLGTLSGRVLRSTDSGLTWTATVTGLQLVTALAFSDAANGLAVDYSDSPTGGLISTTTDGGATWKVRAPGSGPLYYSSLAGVPGRPKTFVSAGFDFNTPATFGSSYSTDGGLTWTAIDTQLHSTVAFLNASTGYSSGYVHMSNPDGMFRGMLPAAALATTAAQPLTSLAVYPNPASDYFTVAVPAVAGASRVQATLYNALGQAVARQEAALPAAGQQLGFAAAGLAAGLYTLRVQAGEQVASQPVSVR